MYTTLNINHAKTNFPKIKRILPSHLQTYTIKLHRCTFCTHLDGLLEE